MTASHSRHLDAGAEFLGAHDADGNGEPTTKLLRKSEALTGIAPELSRSGTKRALARPTTIAAEERAYSVSVLTRIAEPVLDALSKQELKKRMPIHDWEKHRAAWTHYEAFARTLAGIAPWLELGPDDTAEGRLRAHFIALARQAVVNATNPASPDFLNFGTIPAQPLVEAAYFAAALLSAPRQLWEPLDVRERSNVVNALRASRSIRRLPNNNWVLFPAMVEAALWYFGEDFESKPIEAGIQKMEEWYVGEGTYGDGHSFHWDYYNSYVMHPMLLQVLSVAGAKGHPLAESLPAAMERGQRYAEVLENLISPEGTFPVIGRSSAYRFAAFYHLANMALRKMLPDSLEPGAVRGAITAVVRHMTEGTGTFDEEGWLNLGAVGSQPGIRDPYNATGSLYVCLTGLVHLGLSPDDPFWTVPAASWTQKRIWNGENVWADRGGTIKLSANLPDLSFPQRVAIITAAKLGRMTGLEICVDWKLRRVLRDRA